MSYVFLIHRIVGSMVLPLLLLVAAIWFTIAWKPTTWPTQPARAFRVLVGLQGLLGLVYWIFQLVWAAQATIWRFPLCCTRSSASLPWLPPSCWCGRTALSARLGRWTPLVSFVSILVLVVGAVIIANNV